MFYSNLLPFFVSENLNTKLSYSNIFLKKKQNLKFHLKRVVGLQ